VDAQHVDVAALLADGATGVRWSATSQLQSNVVALAAGGSVDEHVESSLDVLLVVVAGGGRVTHSRPGRAPVVEDVGAPAVLLLPAGTRRSLQAGPDGLVLVTAHRARPPFLPGRAAPG
jgi:quercetin dioxygenase-like cupin family protein